MKEKFYQTISLITLTVKKVIIIYLSILKSVLLSGEFWVALSLCVLEYYRFPEFIDLDLAKATADMMIAVLSNFISVGVALVVVVYAFKDSKLPREITERIKWHKQLYKVCGSFSSAILLLVGIYPFMVVMKKNMPSIYIIIPHFFLMYGFISLIFLLNYAVFFTEIEVNVCGECKQDNRKEEKM